MSAKTWNPLSPSFRARNSMKFQQKSESTTNFQQLNHGFSDPKFKFVASQKLALNTSQTRVDEPNLKDSRRLPSSKKKKKSPKLRVLPGWIFFPTDPTTTTNTRTSPRLRPVVGCSTHLERTHLLRQLVEATASIQALQNVRNIDDLRRLAGWLAGRLAPVGAPAALRSLLVGPYWRLFTSLQGGGRVVAFLGGELGRFSCDSCGKLGKLRLSFVLCLVKYPPM